MTKSGEMQNYLKKKEKKKKNRNNCLKIHGSSYNLS